MSEKITLQKNWNINKEVRGKPYKIIHVFNIYTISFSAFCFSISLPLSDPDRYFACLLFRDAGFRYFLFFGPVSHKIKQIRIRNTS